MMKVGKTEIGNEKKELRLHELFNLSEEEAQKAEDELNKAVEGSKTISDAAETLKLSELGTKGLQCLIFGAIVQLNQQEAEKKKDAD